MVLTSEQKQSFITDGFVVLRNAVPLDLVKDALQVADDAFAANQYSLNKHNPNDVVPIFDKEVEKSPAISTIMSSTVLHDACDDLLGQGNSRYGKKAQIAFRPTDERLVENGMGLTENMPKHRWHIDGGNGKYMKTASPFTLLVGVVLSEGQDVNENRGQFTVWPGSHLKLHPILCERVKKDLITDNGRNLFGYGPSKPDMGQPVRVLLRPGDAVIAHQRLGHAGGINLHERTRKNLYFRVHHKRHDDFLDQILEGCSVFTEFDGIRDMVGDL
eukprot:GFKZ01010842.1.p1 GENE.GFKZ01010842.1~~GFKZ01010842.1.p1  ORF type:complete len:273 (+),score=37.71 GFKZ01010842.1:100-918(+)